MIQIHFYIQSGSFSKTKTIQFCKNHEKNLEILYDIAKDSIEKEKEFDLDQLMMVASFHVVNGIRQKSSLEKIKEKLSGEFSKYQNAIQTLNSVEKFSIEAKIDAFPKKILCLATRERFHAYSSF